MSNSEPVVFIVDDDDAVRDSLSMLIEAVGLKVRTYGNAQSFWMPMTPDKRAAWFLTCVCRE